MRIALLTYRGNMYCGGQGIYAAYLAREWKRAGHDVHVIAGPPLPELEPGIPLHVIPNENVFGQEHPDWLPKHDPFALFKPLSLWELGVSRFGVFPEMQTFGLRLLMRWRRLHRQHKFDVVFDNQCLSWGLLGIRATGVPVVSVIHHPLHIDREADYAIDPKLVKKLKRTLYFPLLMQQLVAPRLDKIVTVSEASRREIERYFGIREKDVSVVYNGTDTEFFRPTPGVSKDADLLFVGRTEDRKKGLGTLLEALALLPESITLKIVDGRIPDDGLVMRFLRRHRIEHRVKLVRRMLTPPELVREYSTARAAVVPSFFEGFGFPASEAMACGLPVIANAAGALPEVVGTDGHAGILVPPRDARAMAAAIERLLADPERTAQLGRTARKRIQSVFQWRDTAQSLVGVFEETLRAAPRRPRVA
ncbi:MAG: glycosyltransferase family 4 protein [Myxococcota bacterium]|jgi:glycosyltransferase involved in cell wall biosynthesis|nr:glycosyl transferase family 1 [Deltaproteobacteria bacterium]MCP4241240.1 glycosyltransferase family 4 protein [bacterium]MDP6074702.1 glycosyltransferase family 4 protein [Myxococcota bacterium]MDP6243780.1 glycosyltransferase family 4 protein [Myxococcota bacterium]MDP7073038.1 glycosyltransferase family 4 protein [Myxococcota bacterium]